MKGIPKIVDTEGFCLCFSCLKGRVLRQRGLETLSLARLRSEKEELV